MKVLFVCGSYPPEKCANADTALIMVNLLKKNGLEIEVLSNIDWGLKRIFKIIRFAKKYKADIVHIQYPGMGFKRSLVPQILAFITRKKSVITIHEVSQVHFLRKLSLLPYSFCSHLIFTNDFDRSFYLKIFPWTSSEKSKVVPIGSNIQVFKDLTYNERRRNVILYFGQIRPQKGLEKVIELAKLIKNNRLDLEVFIVGRTYNEFETYFNEIQNYSVGLPISWKLNLPEEDVSTLLGTILFAYLPFPDGASERRGSSFATMAHHMITFTTQSKITPYSLNSSVVFVNKPEEVLSYIAKTDILNVYQDLAKNSDLFLQKYSWEKIIKDYIELFKTVPHP